LAIMGAALLQGGCARLPALDGRPASVALGDTADTRLGEAVLPFTEARPGLSGVVPLADGRDAFAARAELADAAERTLDVQYYIWRDDMSGTLLAEALRRAADRGVRVRLLLDDNNTAGLDERLAALDAHPGIEVRLFNPFAARRWRVLGFLTDFARLNRRMHNKSFTADNQATIVGGRNVGDEYFGAGQDALFVDLDLLAVGPVVDEVSREFDRYWASDSSYPADRVLPAVDPAATTALTGAASPALRDPAVRAYAEALDRSPFVRDMLAGRLRIYWAPARVLSDDPAKGLGRAAGDALLWTRLKEFLGAPTRELELVSPYFVPGAGGVEFFAALAERGVRVKVLTNALEATDVAIVHAGYAKRREPLLEAGVALFEMKRAFASPSGGGRGLTGGSSGSSYSSLHAKTFSVDRSRVFIGSFNFDPRSARLNTEIGFVIDSPDLARAIADALAENVPTHAYEVRLTDAGMLRWVERADGRELVHDREPGTGPWLRVGVWLVSLLPIDWLL
jgi:putative cardiolipin synthase